MVTPTLVRDWSRRRLDCISRLTPESDWCLDELLANGAALGSQHFFCDILLPRECRSVLEPCLAIDCRSRYPRFYQTIPSWDARHLDKRFYCNSCRGDGQHLAHGAAGRCVVTDCDMRAIWGNTAASAFQHRKRRRFCRCHRHSFDPDCSSPGDSSGTTAQPLAIGERTNGCPLARFACRDRGAG